MQVYATLGKLISLALANVEEQPSSGGDTHEMMGNNRFVTSKKNDRGT